MQKTSNKPIIIVLTLLVLVGGFVVLAPRIVTFAPKRQTVEVELPAETFEQGAKL